MWKAKFFFLFILSFIISFFFCEWKGNIWEEKIRSFYYNDSVPSEYKISIDENGIPFINYVGAGKRYNPTAVSIYAIDYYNQLAIKKDSLIQQKFFNCIHWLEKNSFKEKNYSLLKFDWQQPYYPEVKPIWTSSISSGKAIEAFTDAYLFSHSEIFLQEAKNILRGFYLPIDSGGFSYKDSAGWWFEEYAAPKTKTPHILNGNIFSLLGVRKYFLVTKNDSADFIFKKGIEGLKNNLQNYDVGDGWSYYDIFKKKSDKKYQKIVVEQMKDLYEITGDKIVLEYYEKWKTPLEEYYLIRIIKEKNRSGIILFLLLNLGALATLLFVSKLFSKRK